MKKIHKIAAVMFVSIALFSSPSMSAATAKNLKCKGCVGSSDIAKNAVTSSRIKSNSVTTSKIKDGAVTLNKFGADVLDNLDGASAKVATTAPTPDDDINSGYSEGKIWVDVIQKVAYILVDNSLGLAVWKPITTTLSIAGSWYLESDNKTLITFIYDGVDSKYFVTQDVDAGETLCWDGMESGTYTLNRATGSLSLSNVIDTTGDCGLTSTQGETYDVNVAVSGNSIIFTDDEGSFALARVTDASNAIVGGWYIESANRTLITFIDESNYFVTQDVDNAGEPLCSDGMEYGSYVWDSGTGSFNLTNAIDTTGECGLTSVQGDVYSATNNVSGAELTITDGEGSFSLNFVQ